MPSPPEIVAGSILIGFGAGGLFIMVAVLVSTARAAIRDRRDRKVPYLRAKKHAMNFPTDVGGGWDA